MNMPKNRAIYIGVLVLVASALIWAGAQLTQRIEWILPYTAIAGVVLIVVGVIYEVRKHQTAAPAADPHVVPPAA